jgi:hypothetical protein
MSTSNYSIRISISGTIRESSRFTPTPTLHTVLGSQVINEELKRLMDSGSCDFIHTQHGNFHRVYMTYFDSPAVWHSASGFSQEDCINNLSRANGHWQAVEFVHDLGKPPTGDFLRTIQARV